MSSDSTRHLYPMVAKSDPETGSESGANPAQQNESAIAIQQGNNLVTLEPRDTDQRRLLNILQQLVHQLEQRSTATEARVDTLASSHQSIADLTDSLGMRTEDVEAALAQLDTHTEQLQATQQLLLEQTQQLADTDESLRAEHAQLAQLLEQLREHNQEIADRHAALLQRLQNRVQALGQHDKQLDAKIDADRERLDQIEPHLEQLEQDKLALQDSTQILQQKTSRLGQFSRRLAWSTGAFALLAVLGLGTLSYSTNHYGEQIDKALTTLGVQQQDIASLHEMNAALNAQIQTLPGQIDQLYQSFSENDARLQADIAEVDASVQAIQQRIATTEAGLSHIQQRLDVPQVALSAGAYDLSKVPSEAHLQQQPAQYYTIQLAGTHGPNGLANFIGRHRQQLDLQQISYAHTLRQGRDWYVLLQGNYATASEANAAAERLAPSLQRNGPYVRQFATIQQQITDRQNLVQ